MHRVSAFSCNNLCPTYQDDWAGTAARFDDANFSLDWARVLTLGNGGSFPFEFGGVLSQPERVKRQKSRK